MLTNVQAVQKANEIMLQQAVQGLRGEEQSGNSGLGMAKFANVMDTFLAEEAGNKEKARFKKEKEAEKKVVPISASAKDRKIKRDKKRRSGEQRNERVVKKEGADVIPIFNDPTLGWAVDLKA